MPTPNQIDYYAKLRKLSPDTRQAIRSAYDVPLHKRPTLAYLARQYNVSVNLIFRIVHTND